MSLDIKLREEALEREQKLWKSKKNDLNGEIHLLKSRNEALSAKNKQLSDQSISFMGENDRLTQEGKLLKESNVNLRQENRELQRNNEKLSADNDQLSQSLVERESIIDDEVEEYRQKKFKEARDSLNESTMELRRIQERKNSLNHDVEILEEKTIEVKKASEIAQRMLDDAKIAVRDESNRIHDDLNTLKEEEKSLLQKVSSLNSQIEDKKAEYITLEQKNREFREYESKAMKILSAKDEDLINRERVTRQKEAITRPTTTFLPDR